MSKKPNGFEKPNHTQTPNSFFDEVMKDIDTMAELKVTLAIIRQTIGWHRKRARFGVGKIERLTGLARNSVISGAEAAEARGTIRRIETTGEAEWELVIQDTPSTVEGAEFEGDATDEGVPPQDLTQTPSSVEGHKRKKEIIKEKDILDGILEYQLKPKAIQDAIRTQFKLTPNWDAKYNRQFMEWAMQEKVTPEQIQMAAKVWGSDKRFNWSHPNLKGIQEQWLQLTESEPSLIAINTQAVDATKQMIVEKDALRYVPPPPNARPQIRNLAKGLTK